MSEDALRASVKRALAPFGIVQRIECPMESGIPDLALLLQRPHLRGQQPSVMSWVELKHTPGWPARPETPLMLKHFTREQLLWGEAWHENGGRYAMLLQVGRDYLLLPAPRLRLLFEGATRRELTAAADVYGRNEFPRTEVMKWLTR